MARLAELVLKMTGTKILNIGGTLIDQGSFSSTATLKIMTGLADRTDSLSILDNLCLSYNANFEEDEAAEKLADVLHLAASLKKCDLRM